MKKPAAQPAPAVTRPEVPRAKRPGVYAYVHTAPGAYTSVTK